MAYAISLKNSGAAMSVKKPSVISKKPKSILTQHVSVNYKSFGLAIVKGAGHALLGKFDDLADDGADTLAALGLEGKTPDVLLFILLQQAIQSALAALIEDSRDHLPDIIDPQALLPIFEEAVAGVVIDERFFENPLELPLLGKVASAVRDWLVAAEVPPSVAATISMRLPGFFPYALHREWLRNGKHYETIRTHIKSPFTKAAEREAAWQLYAAQLQQRLDEGVFGEAFSLRQIYIPLNATYDEDISQLGDSVEPRDSKRRVVVKLHEELESWLSNKNKDDAVRTVSGGPGCGKSSFAKVFAADVAQKVALKVLFVPLHLIDPTRDFFEEIGRFVRDEGVLKDNPLGDDQRETGLLIVLDGLDELASQGKTAAATARDFVRTVQQTVDRRNLNGLQLRVLFCGREVVVQESESEFRRHRQVLVVLPYIVEDAGIYHDPSKLLQIDLRQAWWRNYGLLNGDKHEGLPQELNRSDLTEITAQPLLNYLLALSFLRKKLDFDAGVNLNQIYRDLLEAVYVRGYEQGRCHASVRDLKAEDFFLILEEVGLAAWHGDGRSTTVGEIEQHCRDGGLDGQLEAFQDGAKRGITRLLAAFFFRQHGERPKGDHTFVFTHKSFGEYLAARRLVRAMQDVAEEMQRRETTGRGKGWGESDALERWAKWTGPTALSPFIHKFLIAEVALENIDEVMEWHSHFTRLFNYVLAHGMPMERILLPNFQDALFQSRNAEEALLAALNACAIATKQLSKIKHPNVTAFGTWFKRNQGQRSGPVSALSARCLSWMDLENIALDFCDLYGADLSNSNLNKVKCYDVALETANLSNANLSSADLRQANLRRANLHGADLRNANLNKAELSYARLTDASLESANLSEANLSGAKLSNANLSNANLIKANLVKADIADANLSNANLSKTQQASVRRTAKSSAEDILDKVASKVVRRRPSKQPVIDKEIEAI